MSIAEALPIIEESAGSHFDPAVVEALRLRVDEFQHAPSASAEAIASS
jgi:HD-GYP domain-containing protein (c-di-GMP phosphodiesterase class II)